MRRYILFVLVLVMVGSTFLFNSPNHLWAAISANTKPILRNYFGTNASLDRDGNAVLNIIDLASGYGIGSLATPTVGQNTPTPTTGAPTPTSGPIPTFAPGQGIWISQAELMARPTTGTAWTNVLNAANSSWGGACLDNIDCNHDINTLAGALVAARTGDGNMRQKAIGGLHAATGSSLSRALELGRGLQSYVIAADVLGYRDPAFMAWVRRMLYANVQGHSGGTGLLGTGLQSGSNWGGHARASWIAGYLYLKDPSLDADFAKMTNAYKAFIGMDVANQMQYTSTSWHPENKPKSGVNRLGSVRSGQDISGVLPEDWRRGGEFKWPPSQSTYMWGGMQGFVVSAVLMHRAGVVPINSGDNALIRAMDVLYRAGIPLDDEKWIPWLVNYYAGKNYETVSPTDPGKGMGWTDWTHQR